MIGNRKLAAALALFALAVLAPPPARAQGDNSWNWIRADDGKKIEVKVHNKVEFNEDYSDVSAIPSDGSLAISDSRGSDAIRLVVTRVASGALERDYTVNGARREFDTRAAAWLKDVLLLAARQGGLDARERVRRILARGGSRALIEEIAHVEGDYVRRIYFDELLKVPNLGDGERRDALRDASQSIRSDYERAELLQHAAPVYLAKNALTAIFFEALSRVGSDYERHRVLKIALKQADLSTDALVADARSAAAMTSDYEKATFLVEAASRYANGDARLRAAFFDALRTVGSDYEHHRVLSAVVKSPSLSREALIAVAQSAAALGSDYEKATFLVEAASRYQTDEQARGAFVAAMRTIGSEYERNRVEVRLPRMTTN
ncbi:MAG: hypothetical protein ABR563_18060 [Pyrinomonadaceae bacterium]